MIVSRKIRFVGCINELDIYVDGEKIDKIDMCDEKVLKLSKGYHKICFGLRDKIRSNEINLYISEEDDTRLACSTWILLDFLFLIFIISLATSFHYSSQYNYRLSQPLLLISMLFLLIYGLTANLKKNIVSFKVQ